jgi:hypothetical protein
VRPLPAVRLQPAAVKARWPAGRLPTCEAHHRSAPATAAHTRPQTGAGAGRPPAQRAVHEIGPKGKNFTLAWDRVV